jgi:hypothetical protein
MLLRFSLGPRTTIGLNRVQRQQLPSFRSLLNQDLADLLAWAKANIKEVLVFSQRKGDDRIGRADSHLRLGVGTRMQRHTNFAL